MIQLWVKLYDFKNIALQICEKYDGCSAGILYEIYSIYNKYDAKLLIWKHSHPLKDRKFGYWYDEDNTDYHKFSSDLNNKLMKSYKQTPTSHNLYKVFALIIYIYKFC